MRSGPRRLLRRVADTAIPSGVGLFLVLVVLDESAAQVKLARWLYARHVFARQSEHCIMFSQPGVIVRAIRGLVRAVRRDR